MKNWRNASEQSCVDFIADHILSGSTPVYSQPYFFAQRSSGNCSEVCESESMGINGEHMELVSWWLIFFFLIQNKQCICCHCSLKMVAFAANPLTKYLREASTSRLSWIHYLVNRWTGVVSSVLSLLAECKWDSCPFLGVLLINGTFLFCCNTSCTFFSQASPKYSCY